MLYDYDFTFVAASNSDIKICGGGGAVDVDVLFDFVDNTADNGVDAVLLSNEDTREQYTGRRWHEEWGRIVMTSGNREIMR